MRRRTLWWSMAAWGLITSAPALAQTSVRASLGIGMTVHGEPPPPVVALREPPRLVMVSGSTVYVVDDGVPMDCDLFRYGVYWYAYDEGYWFRARSYRGPFRLIEVRYVPRAVISVPPRHWRHHPHGGPPGLMRKRGGHDGESGDRGRRGRARGKD